MDKNLVFIASGGRTGTQFLGDLLSSVIDDCWSEHEADVFVGLNRKSLARIRRFGLWHVVFGRALGATGLRAIAMNYVMGKITLEQAAERLHAERDSYYAQRPEKLIVDSYPRWWGFIGEPNSTAMQDLIAFVSDHGSDQFNTQHLDASAMAPHNASKASPSDWQEWTAKECAEVDLLCGPLMDRFGYPRLLKK